MLSGRLLAGSMILILIAATKNPTSTSRNKADLVSTYGPPTIRFNPGSTHKQNSKPFFMDNTTKKTSTEHNVNCCLLLVPMLLPLLLLQRRQQQLLLLL